MNESFVFDGYGSISERREEFLGWLLSELNQLAVLKTAVDVGCGVGVFADFLRGRGLTVVGLDARADHIAEARKRYHEVQFHVQNVEDPVDQDLGPADLVLCFGLLYHLENPFRAIRNLHVLTRKVAVIESMVIPGGRPGAILLDEGHREDQSLEYVAFVPSESCLVKMLYRAGYAAVYKPTRMPEHQDFATSVRSKKKRTILVAAQCELALPALQRLPEVFLMDVWKRAWVHRADRVLHLIKNPFTRNSQ